MEFIEKMLGQVDSVTSMLVYAVIVLLFIFGLIKCVLPVIRTRGVLRHACKSIKNGDKKQSWQDDYFLGKGALYSHWSEYLNNLFFADGVYHNASNVEDYINEDTVIYAPGNSGFADTLPGLMVSLGFLGTLIGLSIGLSGFSMGDEAAIMTSIETLIPGMRYAFMTSIVGVICSVAFTLISRFVNGSADRAIVDFYGVMSRHAGVLSVDPLTQVAIYQQEQTALIQTMAKDLNGKFTERMAKCISESTVPLQETLTKFVSVTTQEQMRFLDTVVTRFVSHMDQALGGQFDNLADVMDSTIRNQERMLKAVDGHIGGISRTAVELNQLEKSVSGMLDRFDGYVSKLNAAQKLSDEAYSKVAGNFEQMQLVSRQQAEYLKSVSAMQNSVSITFAGLRDGMDAIKSASDGLLNTAKKISDLRSEIDDSADRSAQRLSKAHSEALQRADGEIANMLDSLSAYMRDYTARVDDMTASIGDAIGRLPGSVTATADQLLDQIERMNSALNRAQRAMDDAVDKMYGR